MSKKIEPVDAHSFVQVLSLYARKYRNSPVRQLLEEMIDKVMVEDKLVVDLVDFLVELYLNGMKYEDITRFVELVVPSDYVASTIVNFKRRLFERRVRKHKRRTRA